MVYKSFLTIGLVFGFIAALMAYLISYEEYSHHYTNDKKPRMLSLKNAFFAFLFFVLIMAVAGYFADKV